MATDFIDNLQNSFNEKAYQDISQYVEINIEATKNGLKAVVPIMLASILSNNIKNISSPPSWWDALDAEHSENNFANSNKIKNAAFIVIGREVVSGIFKSNYTKLNTAVSSVAGIQKGKSDKLIEASVPLIVLQMKRLMQQKKWKYKNLIEHLIENKQNIIKALPVGVSPQSIGLEKAIQNNSYHALNAETSNYEKPKKSRSNGLLWFGGIVVIAIVVWYFMGSRSCTRSMNTDDLLVPDVSSTTITKPTYEKVKDGTYYANEIKPKIIMMRQK